MPEVVLALVASALIYLVVAGLVALDAVFPLAPSETLLVAGGVLVASGEMSLILLAVAGAMGALVGHLILYAIGHSASDRAKRWIERGPEGARRLDVATRHLKRRPWLIVVADFVPWGRTILMFSAGALGHPFRRFLPFAAVGALVWASVFTGLGVLGGAVFEGFWPSLLASLAVVATIAIGFEVASWLRRSTKDRGERRERLQTDRAGEAETVGDTEDDLLTLRVDVETVGAGANLYLP